MDDEIFNQVLEYEPLLEREAQVLARKLMIGYNGISHADDRETKERVLKLSRWYVTRRDTIKREMTEELNSMGIYENFE